MCCSAHTCTEALGLSAEAEVCALDGDGRSALDWAESRGRGHVVQALQRHERLHRLLDEQRAASQADMSTKLFTAEARLAQLGTELAATSRNSGSRQPAEQLAPLPDTGVEEMVESLQQQNALLEQRELERVDLEQRLKICEQEEHSCKDALVRERELQQHHGGSLRAELEYEKKQFDMWREEHASGLTRAEEEVQQREATWHRERLQCEEAEQRLRERETMEQQRNDVAQRAIQKLEQEVAAAEDRAELLQKEVVAAEEEARQAQARAAAASRAWDGVLWHLIGSSELQVMTSSWTLGTKGGLDAQSLAGPTWEAQKRAYEEVSGSLRRVSSEAGRAKSKYVTPWKLGHRTGTAASLIRIVAADGFAYVVCLWGRNAEYVLGAMVLAHSLKRSGTRHDLVALHTDDVPKEAVELLQKAGWHPRQAA
ncbi:unnamed protein product [Symbiodinium necroappetens]|uniref:Reticulocyte-binding protein 2-like a n=1 Tax=Symbiodinium necroappetens TaxID=1628268 RepID=A0A813CL20_9DINO|nr:unnamed protein product [Symbiodinium necroappetens]